LSLPAAGSISVGHGNISLDAPDKSTNLVVIAEFTAADVCSAVGIYAPKSKN